MQALYASIDALNAVLIVLESKLKGITIKQDGLRLSIERYGDQMRLCWDGKPICECKAEEKIEAAEHVGALLDARNEIIFNLTERAQTATKHVAKLVESL